jgi:hypothetical protein
MHEPSYPLEYTGPTCEALMYGDWVRIVRDIPHGTAEPNGDKYIGQWCEVQVYPEDYRVIAPRREFEPRKR